MMPMTMTSPPCLGDGTDNDPVHRPPGKHLQPAQEGPHASLAVGHQPLHSAIQEVGVDGRHDERVDALNSSEGRVAGRLVHGLVVRLNGPQVSLAGQPVARPSARGCRASGRRVGLSPGAVAALVSPSLPAVDLVAPLGGRRRGLRGEAEHLVLAELVLVGVDDGPDVQGVRRVLDEGEPSVAVTPSGEFDVLGHGDGGVGELEDLEDLGHGVAWEGFE
jgi:hypothetical protein